LSTRQQSPTTAETEHSTTTEVPWRDDSLDRLIVEAGKLLDRPAGTTIDRREVRLQAEANGWTKDEARTLTSDLPPQVEIPEQGNLFGDLWQLQESERGIPSAVTPSVLERFEDYRFNQTHEWRGNRKCDHNFNQKTARKRIARWKTVARFFERNYDPFTTVLVTYSVSESDKPLAEQADALFPRAVVRERRDILKDLNVYDEYAGVTVLAPKYNPDDDSVIPSAVTPRLHAHDFYLLPGTVSAEAFESLVIQHIKHVDGATVDAHRGKDNRLAGASITAETWGTQYREPLPHGPRDVLRGPTTSLAVELGNNLPWLKHPNADYVMEFSAGLWQGEDKPTIQRWRPMGRPSRFKHLAVQYKHYDRLREGATTACILFSLYTANQ
jgi:hypothetical protein